MPTVQLRRYEFGAGDMDGFLPSWRQLVPVYRQFGLDVLFAFVDRERDELLWAVYHAGDAGAFDEAKAALNRSPERAAVQAQGTMPHPRVTHVSTVEVEIAPHAPEPANT